MVPISMAGRWCAYLLWCSDGSLYAGATNDLASRLSRHNAGTGARYTRSRGPVRLARVFYRADKSAALRSEAAIKRLTRAEKLALATLKKIRAPMSRRPRSGQV
jgi:putative endonuclease